MKSLTLVLLPLLLSGSLASGRSFTFALTSDVHTLGKYTKMYHDAEGSYPATWTEFEKRFGPTDQICSVLNPNERFTFVPTTVLLPAYPTEERILLISRDPFRPPTERQIPILNTWYKTVGDEVYVAAVQQGDRVFVRRIPPTQVEQVFHDAGVALPESSGLGLFPHERVYRGRMIAYWLGAVLASAVGIWAIVKHRKRNSEQAVGLDAE